MAAMRAVEVLINEFQNEERTNISKKEIDLYHQIGDNALDRFYKKYYDLF